MPRSSDPVLLPTEDLARAIDVVGDALVPRYLSSRDALWLGALLDEYARAAGTPRLGLSRKLAEAAGSAPKAKRRIACRVLDRLSRATPTFTPRPADVRAALFAARARVETRAESLAVAAEELSVEPSRLEPLLFADLPHEARVGPLPAELGPRALALEVNLALVASLVARATLVRVSAYGDTRAVARQARLSGLICTARRAATDERGIELEISGPFSLFRHTALYGRRLAALVPRLAGCDHFELTADCSLAKGRAHYSFRCRSDDPLPRGREPGRRESHVAERFARDFEKLGSGWDLVRLTEPLGLEDRELVFPDLLLTRPRAPERRVFLEVVGFWTRHHLEDKLARVARAAGRELVLCVDAERGCRDEAPPDDPRVVPFVRRIDAKEVLRRLEAASGLAVG